MAPKKRAPPRHKVVALLWGEVVSIILRWGTLAGALTAIVISVSYALPAAFRYYSSDEAPWEGRLQHNDDLVAKLLPLNSAIVEATKAAQSAATAANNSLERAESIQIKSDQADLCRAVDRLANIEALLKMDPMNSTLQEFRAMRLVDIARIRKKFETSGVIAEC